LFVILQVTGYSKKKTPANQKQTLSFTDINSLGEDGCGAAKFAGDLAKQSELEFEAWKIRWCSDDSVLVFSIVFTPLGCPNCPYYL